MYLSNPSNTYINDAIVSINDTKLFILANVPSNSIGKVSIFDININNLDQYSTIAPTSLDRIFLSDKCKRIYDALDSKFLLFCQSNPAFDFSFFSSTAPPYFCEIYYILYYYKESFIVLNQAFDWENFFSFQIIQNTAKVISFIVTSVNFFIFCPLNICHTYSSFQLDWPNDVFIINSIYELNNIFFFW